MVTQYYAEHVSTDSDSDSDPFTHSICIAQESMSESESGNGNKPLGYCGVSGTTHCLYIKRLLPFLGSIPLCKKKLQLCILIYFLCNSIDHWWTFLNL